MLVLTRHTNQSIMIGDDVIVSVLEIHGDQVRLGIDAPRHVPVHRREVWAEVRAANEGADLSGRPLHLLDGVAPTDPTP